MMQQVTQNSNDKVGVFSEEFAEYMKMLVFLKEPKTKPIISKLNPKMCLTCWQIFTDREKVNHPQSGGAGPNPVKHKITGTFQSMVQAQKESILALSRQWKKTSGVAGSSEEFVEKLELCPTLKEHMLGEKQQQPQQPQQQQQPPAPPARAPNNENSVAPSVTAGAKRLRPALKEIDQPDQNQKQPEPPQQQIITTDQKKAAAAAPKESPAKAYQQTTIAFQQTRASRRNAKIREKGQAQIEKSLQNTPVTAARAPIDDQKAPAAAVVPVSKAQPKAQTQAEQLQDILQQDAKVSPPALPSTVLLRPVENGSQVHASTSQFQTEVLKMLGTILSRVGKLEDQLNAKHFLPSSTGEGAASSHTEELVEKDQQQEPEREQEANKKPAEQEKADEQPRAAGVSAGNPDNNQDTVSEHSDDQHEQLETTEQQQPQPQPIQAAQSKHPEPAQQDLAQQPAQLVMPLPTQSQLVQQQRTSQVCEEARVPSSTSETRQLRMKTSCLEESAPRNNFVNTPAKEIITIELD